MTCCEQELGSVFEARNGLIEREYYFAVAAASGRLTAAGTSVCHFRLSSSKCLSTTWAYLSRSHTGEG